MGWIPETEQSPDYMGVSQDRENVRYWDPVAQQYTTEAFDASDPRQYNPTRGNFGYYYNSQGDYVYGRMPEQTHITGEGMAVAGPDPAPPRWVPDALGMGADGGQRNPSNTQAGQVPAGEEWQGSTSHDIFGSPRPGYQPITQNPYTGDPFTAGAGLQMGPGVGVAGLGPAGQAANVPLQGYESSTNRDFYQRQFADMRAQQMRNQAAQQTARDTPAQQGGAPADPWSWANLPDVVQGGAVPEGANRGDWMLNPAYDWTPGETTKGQILSDLGGLLTTEEQALFNEHARTSPTGGNLDSLYWASAPRADVFAQTFGGSNEQDPVWTDALQKVLNNVWVQAGDAPTAGGMNIPAGYASPTNA